jgi:hypothetical protein
VGLTSWRNRASELEHESKDWATNTVCSVSSLTIPWPRKKRCRQVPPKSLRMRRELRPSAGKPRESPTAVPINTPLRHCWLSPSRTVFIHMIKRGSASIDPETETRNIRVKVERSGAYDNAIGPGRGRIHYAPALNQNQWLGVTASTGHRRPPRIGGGRRSPPRLGGRGPRGRSPRPS